MRYTFTYYETDVSFDYGDFPNSTCSGVEPSGFYIDIDKDDNVDITSLEGYGDFQNIEKKIKTLEDFLLFLRENREHIQPKDLDVFDELEDFVYASLSTKIFKKYGRLMQRLKLAEECAELIRAIIRSDEDNIIEEMADVLVLIDQLKFNTKGLDTKLKDIKAEKVARQIERITNDARNK